MGPQTWPSFLNIFTSPRDSLSLNLELRAFQNVKTDSKHNSVQTEWARNLEQWPSSLCFSVPVFVVLGCSFPNVTLQLQLFCYAAFQQMGCKSTASG